jgi:hypothetical protein
MILVINNSFGDFIEQRFEQIYPKIQNERRGVLHKVIKLLEKNEGEAQEICNNFAIIESSDIKDDFNIAYDNIGTFFIDTISKFSAKLPFPLSKIEKKVFTELCSNLEDKKQMEVIVVTAIILIAVFSWIKSTSSTQNQPQLPKSTIPSQPVPTAICLAVPASAVCDLTVGDLIKRDKIIRLIDESSDFLCIETKEAEKLSIDIDINQTPSPDNQLRFYIRIDISDGQYIIGEKSKYVIKRDLLPNIRGEIKELGRLKSISSISSFNRI